ncbi:unnamed protein product [Cuscuta campestris]|uniref:Uncharacterized protein n=1 Tax=Cuscuta campestris TaxID=132261 RepID=A0A484NI81_9ASTE|nr:unnamed protein product [Cuscuta campestris]
MGVHVFAANDGCGGSYFKSESSSSKRLRRWRSDKAISVDSKSEPRMSKRLRRWTSDKAFSERKPKENAFFPKVSDCRLKEIKDSILVSSSDFRDSPDKYALSEERQMGSLFDKEFPPDSRTFTHLPNAELGKQMNVLDLLGDNLLSFNQNIPSFRGGVEVKSTVDLEGKYVMICCVFVPTIWCSDDWRMVYHTALASHELTKRDDFMLVVVPIMRKGFHYSCSAYQHFLSGFSCLAVPFDDCDRREYICSALRFHGKLKVVILDPSQKLLYHGPPNMFLEFGGAEHGAFPFTPERREICLSSCYVLQDLSLSELLGRSDPDGLLYNFSEDACITISELNHKFVGIYLCSDCTSLRNVQEVDEECRQKKYELEIVVVCCPFDRQVPPVEHEELIKGALKSSKKLLRWWFFPFDNTVCHRLRRMCGVDSHGEGVFIVDPIGKYVDPYGLPIMRDFGVDSYPFTRRNLVEKEFQRIMGLRLNSLLLPWMCVYATLVTNSGTFIINTEWLKNKIVVLYLYKEKENFLADKLALWYKKNIERKHSKVVEVVAVSIDGSSTSEQYFMDKGWLVCRADPSKSAKLCDEYFHPLCGPHETVVAFGEDGVIQSMDASHILECRGPPFDGNLREEIGREFDYAGFQYLRHYDYSSFMKKGAEIKLRIDQGMEAERDVDVLSASDGCGGSDLKSESSSSKCRRLSTSYEAFSDRTQKLLAEKACFPNVSECRLKQIKVMFCVPGCGDIFDRPDPQALSKEHKIGSYFDAECPIYSQSLARVPKAELGKRLNVLELIGNKFLSFNQKVVSFHPTTKSRRSRHLSTGARWGFNVGRKVQRIQPPKFRSGVEMESTIDVEGKHVMICCVFAPSIWCSEDGQLVYRTALASHDLARRDDFVLVVVPMMRKGFTHCRSAYENFLSGFSCHAVPFWDSPRRERICSALGFDGGIRIVVIDPSRKVLYNGEPSMFRSLGGGEDGCFPFTPERCVMSLGRGRERQDLSLGEFLGLSDTDVLWNASKDACITISELKHRFVGIYVCFDCRSLKKVREVAEECRRKKNELEIVVASCPYWGVPPNLHWELVMDALTSLNLLGGLWLFPFNNTVSRMLSEMHDSIHLDEGFYIVDPVEKFVDRYGLPIICELGMDWYPFTRKSVVEKEFQRLMGLRLSSLLLPWGCVCRRGGEVGGTVETRVEEALNNKVVLLYLYEEEEQDLAVKLTLLMGGYDDEKKNAAMMYRNVEVVAVSIDGGDTCEECFMDKGWWVCRADPSKSAKLCKELFHPRYYPHEAVVAFGEDGRIRSIDACQLLESQAPPPFLGGSNLLRQEIGRELYDAGFMYMRYYEQYS